MVTVDKGILSVGETKMRPLCLQNKNIEVMSNFIENHPQNRIMILTVSYCFHQAPFLGHGQPVLYLFGCAGRTISNIWTPKYVQRCPKIETYPF